MVGIALIGLSAVLILLSTIRFLMIRVQLNRQPEERSSFDAIEIMFALMLAALLAVIVAFLLWLII